MIKIEVRQNKSFEMGYPYNSSVDSYFKSLSEDFINNYGLAAETVIAINDHKNSTLWFDKEIHEFVIKLSAFMVEFETTGKIIIEDFEKLVVIKNDIEQRKAKMENSSSIVSTEFDFVLTNIEQLSADITKINEFIEYYQDQVVDTSYTYGDSYVEDTQTALTLLDDVIAQNEIDFEYYRNTLYDHISSHIVIKDGLSAKSFLAITIRTMYEEWKKRSEVYYQNLVEYFTDEYNTYWTYGESLMYGEKLEADNASTIVLNRISARWQETLFKRYNFTIEQEIKTYSVNWIGENTSFTEEEFNYIIERKKVEIFKRKIYELEQLIVDKKQAVQSAVPILKEQGYFKHREYVLAKRQYMFENVNSTLDQTKMNEFDANIAAYQSDYDYVIAKHNEVAYWRYLADWEMHSELLTDLNRQLDKSERAIVREFKKNESDNTVFLEKIEFYNTEKTDLEEKRTELISMREKLEIESNVFNDELTLMSSKLYENDALITQKRNEYVVFFDERLPFFTQSVVDDEKTGIISLLEGNFFKNYDSSFDSFMTYSTDVEWYNIEDRNKLKMLYTVLMETMKSKLSDAWNKEFSHAILDIKKIDVYDYYVETELKLFYGTIHKHLLDGKYDDSLITDLNLKLDKIKKIFNTYVGIAFNIKQNISFISNMFDYEEKLEFRISEGEETMENTINTFSSILDDVVAFAYSKNMEYKLFEESVDRQENIDQTWLDMEKKYV